MSTSVVRRTLAALALLLSSIAAQEAAARPVCWMSDRGHKCLPALHVICTTTVWDCRLGKHWWSETSTSCSVYSPGSIEELLCTDVGKPTALPSFTLDEATRAAYINDAPPCPAYAPVASFDFTDNGLPDAVPAHRHPNGCGIVANSAYVEPGAYVAPSATVSGSAFVLAGTRVEAGGRVKGGLVKGCYKVRPGQVVSRGSYTAACP